MPALAIRDDVGSEELWKGGSGQRCAVGRDGPRDWVHSYNAEGIAGLCNRPAPGPGPKLTEG